MCTLKTRSSCCAEPSGAPHCRAGSPQPARPQLTFLRPAQPEALNALAFAFSLLDYKCFFLPSPHHLCSFPRALVIFSFLGGVYAEGSLESRVSA